MVNATATVALPGTVARYALCRKLGGPSARAAETREVSCPPGFEPKTVHSVASRCGKINTLGVMVGKPESAKLADVDGE